METKYKISIPKPCHEDWDKMTPNDNGRFCRSCSKNVVDFTTMLPDEIQRYFQQNNNICGRFKNSQLDTLTIQIPSRVLYSQTNYYKMFLLALFIAMGTTLFSCADKNGNKQKIDKVEVVEDSIEMNNITVGVRLPPKFDPNDSLHHEIPPPPPPSKINQVKFKKPKTIRCGEVTSKKVEKTKNETNIIYEDTIVYGGVGIEVNPEYPEGTQKFYEFLKTDYKIPRKAKKLTGEIQASFIIGRDGTLDNIKLINDIEYGTGEEVIRVLKTSRKWYPGERNGKKITERYKLFITLQKDTLNSKKRKRALAKITSIKLIKEGDGREVK